MDNQLKPNVSSLWACKQWIRFGYWNYRLTVRDYMIATTLRGPVWYRAPQWSEWPMIKERYSIELTDCLTKGRWNQS